MEYCNLFKQNSSLGCLTDPSGLSHFPVSDKKMNANFKRIKICENISKSPIRDCNKICKRDCNEEHFHNNMFRRMLQRGPSQLIWVIIKAGNSPIYVYSANPKYSFIIFATNIGSLVSLWLGISAIDLKIIFKSVVNYLDKMLLKLILTVCLNEYFIGFIDFMKNFISYLKKFKKVYLKRFINLFILICFVYQSIKLTLEFTAFKTTIEVEFHPYNDINGSIKSENFPAFSFCFDPTNLSNYFEDYKDFKFINQYTLSEKILTNKLASEKSRRNLNHIFDEAKNISNYLLFLNHSTPLYMMCQLKGFKVTTECIERSEIILSESSLGKCYTYLSGLIDSKYDKKQQYSRTFLKNSRMFKVLNMILFRYKHRDYSNFIHDRNQLPSFAFLHSSAYLSRRYSLIKVKRLPPPYDSNCFNYKTNGLVKSRGHCINYCIIDKILNKYNCIPKNMRQIFTLFDNISLNAMFCSEVNVEFSKEETDCKENCLKPCEEPFFKFEMDTDRHEIIEPSEQKYVIYINKIYMTFIDFMVSFGGLLGLWNNISIYDLLLYLYKFVQIFIDHQIMKIFSKLLILKKLIDSIKIIFIRINLKVSSI
jgi:hypothetical protein